jgi:hypothetical protein
VTGLAGLTSAAGQLWFWIGAGLVAAGIGLLWIGRRLPSGNVMKLFLSFAGIAAPLVGVSLLPLAIVLSSAFSEQIKQALIAGTIIASGWFATFLIQEYRRAEARYERLRDVHRALYAEIGAYVGNIVRAEGELDSVRTEIVRRIGEDATFVPFVPRESPDRVYMAIIDEIHILPRSTIDFVVAFYGQIASISALVEDMATERYAGLTPERRLAMYQDYVALRRGALAFGSGALRVIARYAEGGAKAANRERDLIDSELESAAGAPERRDESAVQ